MGCSGAEMSIGPDPDYYEFCWFWIGSGMWIAW